MALGVAAAGEAVIAAVVVVVAAAAAAGPWPCRFFASPARLVPPDEAPFVDARAPLVPP